MKTEIAQLNLLFGWLWILLGFVSGMVLGMFFRGENWLGGYASFKRRMYRLGHISFFGLGAVNFIFAMTLQNFLLGGQLASIASGSFIIGALTMPLCCVIMAHFPKAHLIFAVPVLSLIAGGVITLVVIHDNSSNFINTRLQPGVSGAPAFEPFQRLARRAKPLKRFLTFSSVFTGLKPGVNETPIFIFL